MQLTFYLSTVLAFLLLIHQLSTGKDKYIQSFELDKELSERGSLIIYVDKVCCIKSHTLYCNSLTAFPFCVMLISGQ